MKKSVIILVVVSLALTGCSTVKRFRNKHDHSLDYRQTTHYEGKRVAIPKDLTDQHIQDYYAVPNIDNPNDPRVPSLTPPDAEPSKSKA